MIKDILILISYFNFLFDLVNQNYNPVNQIKNDYEESQNFMSDYFFSFDLVSQSYTLVTLHSRDFLLRMFITKWNLLKL